MAVLQGSTLTGCNSIPNFISSGTVVCFQQTAAPTSWTKLTSHNNKALRVVSGTASSGGTSSFTAVFASRTIPSTTLSGGQMPAHSHTSNRDLENPNSGGITQGPGSRNHGVVSNGTTIVNNSGSSQAHGHGSLDFAVQYVDIILASKN